MPDTRDIEAEAVRAGIANFEATRGSVPDNFRLLLEHAPATFAGYALMRSSVMREGALSLQTKELVFALIDTVLGVKDGAKVHAANAVRLGLTIEQLSEGLAQCVMAAGITTWNMTGKDVLLHAIATLEEEKRKGQGR